MAREMDKTRGCREHEVYPALLNAPPHSHTVRPATATGNGSLLIGQLSIRPHTKLFRECAKGPTLPHPKQ
jgi:hypothetical protein